MPEQLLLMCMEDPASRLLLAQEVLKKDSLLAQAKAEVSSSSLCFDQVEQSFCAELLCQVGILKVVGS